MSAAPRVRVRVPYFAVEVRGRFRGKPWKVLPQVVPRQFHGIISRRRTIMYTPWKGATARDFVSFSAYKSKGIPSRVSFLH